MTRLPLTVDEEARIFPRVRLTDSGCWEWTGAHNDRGAGLIMFRAKRGKLVHRVLYEVFVRVLPEGVILHHEKCRNPACCNPAHVVETTWRDHPDSASGGHAQKTHCSHGHEFTPENTNRHNARRRRCRTCDRERQRRVRRREHTAPLGGNR